MIITLVRVTGLLSIVAFACYVGGQTPAPNPTPTPDPNAATRNLPVSPAPLGAGGPPPTPPPGSPGYVPPPPASGSRDGFSYAASNEHEGFSVVYPTDGGEPLHVSTSFLEVAMKSRASDAQILQSAQNYEKMNASMSGKFMDQFFPDESAGNANVRQQALQGTERDVIIEQDPLAGPYARVTFTDKEGNVLSESSMSAKAVAGIMEQPYLTPEQKIAALSKPDYTLPESARLNFDGLSAEQLEALVLEKPALAKQEFINAARVIAIEKKQKAERLAARTGGQDIVTTASADALSTQTENEALPADEALDSSAPENTETSDEPEITNADSARGEIDEAESSDTSPDSDRFDMSLVIAAALGLFALGVFSFWIFRSRP